MLWMGRHACIPAGLQQCLLRLVPRMVTELSEMLCAKLGKYDVKRKQFEAFNDAALEWAHAVAHSMTPDACLARGPGRLGRSAGGVGFPSRCSKCATTLAGTWFLKQPICSATGTEVQTPSVGRARTNVKTLWTSICQEIQVANRINTKRRWSRSQQAGGTLPASVSL